MQCTSNLQDQSSEQGLPDPDCPFSSPPPRCHQALFLQLFAQLQYQRLLPLSAIYFTALRMTSLINWAPRSTGPDAQFPLPAKEPKQAHVSTRWCSEHISESDEKTVRDGLPSELLPYADTQTVRRFICATNGNLHLVRRRNAPRCSSGSPKLAQCSFAKAPTLLQHSSGAG